MTSVNAATAPIHGIGLRRDEHLAESLTSMRIGCNSCGTASSFAANGMLRCSVHVGELVLLQRIDVIARDQQHFIEIEISLDLVVALLSCSSSCSRSSLSASVSLPSSKNFCSFNVTDLRSLRSRKMLDSLEQLGEILRLTDPLLGFLAEPIDQVIRHQMNRREVGLGDLVEVDRVVQIGFTDIQEIRDGWQHDVRQHAAFLGAVPIGAEELLDGDLQGAQVGRIGSADDLAEVPQALDRSLAVRGFITHDQTALVVLNRAGQNLAGTGAELACQHHQRTVPRGAAASRHCAPRPGY